jgi:hypothetical protein
VEAELGRSAMRNDAAATHGVARAGQRLGEVALAGGGRSRVEGRREVVRGRQPGGGERRCGGAVVVGR